MKQEKETERKFEIVAKTFFGLENVLAQEIKEIGGVKIEVGNRSVTYEGNKELLYKSNIYLRTALRIMKPILKVKISDQQNYYKVIRSIPWEEYFNLHNSFAIDAIIHSELFKNSHFAALRAKDAVVDGFRDKYAQRPDIAKRHPDILINVHLSRKNLTVSLDSSGESLHKRGYRLREHEAPINEVLAAAMVKLSGWDSSKVLIDPMCGSGTIGIEAAMIAKEIPPGLIRKQYCFMNWVNYDRQLYSNILDAIKLRDIKFQIISNDISSDAIDIARSNARRAMVVKHIQFQNKPYEEVIYIPEKGYVIVNPPYGERIKTDDLETFYQNLGSFFKNNLTGYSISLITSNRKALKHFGLKPVKKHVLYNGALECAYNTYEIFKGGYKDHLSNKLKSE